MTKENWWNARASEEDLNTLAALAKKTKLSGAMSMWNAVRFCLENVDLFLLWLKDRDA
jgi:hypothetical protein